MSARVQFGTRKATRRRRPSPRPRPKPTPTRVALAVVTTVYCLAREFARRSTASLFARPVTA